MMHIDLIIISLFLIITLIIGIHYGRGVTTFQDYAVGSRKLSTMVITLSMLATIYGGSMLSSRPHHYYQQGFYALLIDLASPVNFYLASRFVIVRMKEFIGHLSVAESMGSIYGSMVRVCTAILGIMISIAGLTFQIKVGLNIITILFPEIADFSTHSTILLATLVIVYASFGGARAVAFTDVYQFLLFGLCFPILIFSFLYYAKNPIAQWHKLTAIPAFNLKQLCTWDNSLACVLAHFMWRSVFPFDPARIQRFYMVASLPQAQKVFNYTAISRIFVLLLFLSLAVALHIGGHTIPANQNVLYYIVKLAYFPGMRGILVTTIIALLMSTADSCLHVASVFFANDLWPVITRSGKCQPSLKIARIASVGIGIMSLIMVLHTASMVQLLTKTFSMYGAVISVPFIMTCFGFRPRPAALLLSMGINTIITIYRIYYTTPTIANLSPVEVVVLSGQKIFLSLILSALILLATHYLLPKMPYRGWIGMKDRSLWDLQNQATKRWWLKRIQQLTISFTKSYRANLFPQKASTFMLLGVYVIISTIIALCFMQKTYLFPYIYSYMAVMAMGTILMIYPAFHCYRKGGTPLLHWIWPGLLFILLFIAPLQWAKLGYYSPMVCALLICNLGLTIILLSLEGSIVMFLAALLVHKYMPPNLPFSGFFLFDYKLMSLEPVYAIVFIVAAIVGLSTYKKLRDKANAKLRIIELTRAYEQRISLEAIYNQANWSRLDATHGSQLLTEMSTVLQAPCHYLYTHGQEKLGKEISIFIKKLHKFGKLLLWRAQTERSIELNQKTITWILLEPIILKVHGYIQALEPSIQLLLRNHTTVTHILVDPELFECFLILNLLEASKSTQALDHMLTLTITDTTLQYDYTAATTSSGPAPLILPALAFWFSTDTAMQKTLPVYSVSETGTTSTLPEKQFYQIESRQMVEAHGGYVEVIEREEVLTCLYVLPVEGTKVMHFKTYDPADLTANKLAETTESVAQEKELVTLLTSATDLTKEAVEKAIAFIKNAHGLVTRKSGAPYYTHPMAVAKILLEITKDPSTILAGLLHDVVEDTLVTLNQIELMYGSDVVSIVGMVTHYNTNGYPWKLDDAENKNMLDQCKDIRVVQVKLADRLHNIRTLYARKLVDQKRIAKETMEFYIPWGKKNNISSTWLMEMIHTCQEILNRPG